jgi:PleD family two-component response regulator
MRPEIQGVLTVVYSADAPSATALRESLRACGVVSVRTTRTPDHFLAVCQMDKPDLAILSLKGDTEAPFDLLRRIRAGDRGANPYLPVMMALSAPSAEIVRQAIAAGVHEILVLPTSVNALSGLIHRAVFISRPFIQVPTYVGPCRRRRQIARHGTEDRRKVPWAGYVHAAHKAAVEA